MNAKYAVFGLLLVVAMALTGCSFGQRYVANTTCDSGVMDTQTGNCHTPVDTADAARNAAQAAGAPAAGAPEANAQDDGSAAAGYVTTDGLHWDNPMRAANGNFLHYVGCNDIEAALAAQGVNVDLTYLDGQCHMLSERPVMIKRMLTNVRALGGNGVYYPCDPTGWQSGLSFRVDEPGVQMIDGHGDVEVKACPLPDPEWAADQPSEWPVDSTHTSKSTSAAPATAAPSASVNNEGAAPAAPQATIDCIVHAGVQTTPIEGGCVWAPTVPIDFGSVPSNWKAQNDTGWHMPGENLGVQGQVALYPLGQ